MKRIVLMILILAGCERGGSIPLDPPELPTEPETFGLSWPLIERMEDHFGSRVGIEDLGEYQDGDHYQVTHDGQNFIVVYDADADKILDVSKAGTP